MHDDAGDDDVWWWSKSGGAWYGKGGDWWESDKGRVAGAGEAQVDLYLYRYWISAYSWKSKKNGGDKGKHVDYDDHVHGNDDDI